MHHVRRHPHQPVVLISFHALEKHCKILVIDSAPVSFQIKSTVLSDMVFCGISDSFYRATPESPADSFLFMCAHLPHSQCHGCEPHNRAALDREKNCDWLAVTKWHLQFSSEGYIYWSSRALGRKKKSGFSQPRYEIVTLAGVVWRRERDSADMDQEERWCLWHSNVCLAIRELGYGYGEMLRSWRKNIPFLVEGREWVLLRIKRQWPSA